MTRLEQYIFDKYGISPDDMSAACADMIEKEMTVIADAIAWADEHPVSSEIEHGFIDNGLDFDSLNVGDWLTNKIEVGGRMTGYDYLIVNKNENEIEVTDSTFNNPYTIRRNELTCCLNLRRL